MHQVSPCRKLKVAVDVQFVGWEFLILHFSNKCPLSSLNLVQETRLTPTFLKNIVFLFFELCTQVSYKQRVTAIHKNKGFAKQW